MNTYKAGLIGCGDYLRWLIDDMNNSKKVKVKSTYDLDKVKSEYRAKQLNANPVASDLNIFEDPEIDVIYLFTPPWVRKEYFEKAVKYNKHIITTKPLAPSAAAARELKKITGNNITCAVFYGRTGNASVEKLKEIFKSGEIGNLHIYKEDWFHHYPQWNNWATDPEKNGGPFMDAMIHNLNKARFLIGNEVDKIYFFSENHAQKLKCNDTESMKLVFKNGAAAHLFITWAADLEVFSLDGNDREHIGISHMITDQGWYVTEEEKDGKPYIKAKKEKDIKWWEVKPLEETPWDNFFTAIEQSRPQHFSLEDGVRDIEILEEARKNALR